jgi:hypothetical protein
LSAPTNRPSAAGQHAGDQRDDDVEDDRQQQRLPRDDDVGDAEQERGDRREGDDHDQVVDRDLDERVVRVAAGQLAPHEDHRGARGDAEEDRAGDVLPRLGLGQQAGEHVQEEQGRQRGHRERLDQPVDDQRDHEALRAPADVADGAEVDLDHHRVDHHPDQGRDDEVDVGQLERADRREQARREVAEGDAGEDAQRDPHAEVALEDAEGAGWLVGHGIAFGRFGGQRPPIRALRRRIVRGSRQ